MPLLLPDWFQHPLSRLILSKSIVRNILVVMDRRLPVINCRNDTESRLLVEPIMTSKMWSHYADESRGVVIGYNVDYWVRHLHRTSILKQVQYMDQAPLVMGPQVINQENAYAFISCKVRAWAYEKEWRLITELSKTKNGENSILVITVPQESVSTIYITDRTRVETINIIRQRLKNPSNRYQLRSINRLQGGNDANTLSHNGQIRV